MAARLPEQRGRRIGIAIFWLLAAYLVGMSSWSIIPSLYFPELAPVPREAGAKLCLSELDALERELTSRSADALESRNVDTADRWLREWDRRLATLAGQCGPLERARKDLEAARVVMGSMLERYAQEAAPAQRRTRAALDALTRAPYPPPHG
jgi:hypothetical protein